MKTILALICCMIAVFCFAQHKTTSSVALGLKGGINIANLNDQQESNTSSLTGFHAGLLAHIHVSPTIAVQPEVVYSLQGAKYPTLGKEKIGYVNIPVLFQYMFNGGFRFETGPQVGLVTNAKLERYNNGGTTDIKYQFDNADFSWAFGLGYLSSMGFGIDGRYNLGLTNIVKETTTPHNVKNRVWQFGLFYQFMR